MLQTLSARLGLVTGKTLAGHRRQAYSRPVAIALWIFAEIAIVACDLAELLGGAIALQLLFGLPLPWRFSSRPSTSCWSSRSRDGDSARSRPSSS